MENICALQEAILVISNFQYLGSYCFEFGQNALKREMCGDLLKKNIICGDLLKCMARSQVFLLVFIDNL